MKRNNDFLKKKFHLYKSKCIKEISFLLNCLERQIEPLCFQFSLFTFDVNKNKKE